MIRRLFLLNGLAIIAVVVNHTAYNRGFIELFSWLALKPVDPTAYFDKSGTLTYYVLLILTKLTLFSVPAFLLVSGFFIAYANRGRQSVSNWKIVKTRLITLLIPYLIWSLVIFFGDFLKSGGQIAPLSKYLQELILGLADPTYWYIPLLIQFYLLSPPFLIPLAKTRWQLLLFIAAGVHISTSTIAYLEYFNVEIPGALRLIATHGFFPREMLYFVLGMVVSFQMKTFKQWITRVRWVLFVITIISGAFAIIEADFLFRLTQYTIGFRESLMTTIYIIAIILCFLAFDKVKIPYSKTLQNLSSKSYGIYLLHDQVQGVFIKLIYHLTPFVLGLYIIYLPVLFVVGLGVPYLFMSFVEKSRLKGGYRYLFG